MKGDINEVVVGSIYRIGAFVGIAAILALAGYAVGLLVIGPLIGFLANRF